MVFGFNTDVKFGDTVYHVQSEAREHDHVLQTQVFVKGRCLGKHAASFAGQAGHPDFSEDHLHDLLKEQHKRFVEYARAGTIEDHIESARAVPAAAASAVPAELAAPAAVPEFSVDAPPVPHEDQVATPPIDEVDVGTSSEELAASAEEPAPAADPATSFDAMAVLWEAGTAPPSDDADVTVIAEGADSALDASIAEIAPAENEPAEEYRIEPAGSLIGKGITLECLEPIAASGSNGVLLKVRVAETDAPSPDAQITCRIAMSNGPATYVYSNTNSEGIAEVHVPAPEAAAVTKILIQAAVRGKSVSRKFNLKRLP